MKPTRKSTTTAEPLHDATPEPKPTAPSPAPRHPALQLQQAAGNQSVAQWLQPQLPPLRPLNPPVIRFNETRPWMFSVGDNDDPRAIARELYRVNVDLAPDLVPMIVSRSPHWYDAVQYRVVADLLKPEYATKFHAAMNSALRRDVEHIEDILFKTFIGADDKEEMINTVRLWSRQCDIRDGAGRSYFDRFLGKLKSDTWHRDYLVTTGSSHSFLDTLYDSLAERKSELNTLIAQRSLEFGGYHPLWATGTKAPTGTEAVNEDLVNRSTNIILDALEMYHAFPNREASKMAADTVVGLGAPEKAAVLKAVMSHYDDTDWTHFLGRFGEAWEGGMLYFLFENVRSEDRRRMVESIKSSGIMKPDVVDALAEGRGWWGRNLPWTTYHITKAGKEATEWWAERANKDGQWYDYVMGSFAAAATPETYETTATVLTTAAIGARMSAAPGFAQSLVGRGMLVVGTGVTSYTTTTAVQQLISGHDSNGNQLDNAAKLGLTLQIISGVLTLGAGFAAARQLQVASGRGSSSTALVRPPVAGSMEPAPAPATSSGGSVRFSPLSVNTETGECVVLMHDAASDTYAVLRMNARAGVGTLTNMATGEVLTVENWQIGPARLSLPPGSEGSEPPGPSQPPTRTAHADENGVVFYEPSSPLVEQGRISSPQTPATRPPPAPPVSRPAERFPDLPEHLRGAQEGVEYEPGLRRDDPTWSARATAVEGNRVYGRLGEVYSEAFVHARFHEVAARVRIRPLLSNGQPADFYFEADFLGRVPGTNEIVGFDSKTGGAELTPNQASGYPMLRENGGIIESRNQPGYPYAEELPPTQSFEIRPNVDLRVEPPASPDDFTLFPIQ